MKKLLSVLTFLLAIQLLWAQNQIVTTITPKVSVFPSTGLSYLDDPAKYFTIQMMNTSGTSMDIFFTVELTADFTASNENYYVRTKKDIQPQAPLSVGGVPVMINRAVLDQMIGHLSASAYETNYDRNKLLQDLFVLPEGQYRFCITPYQWTGTNTPNPRQVGEQTCYTFSVCYTGSAPEFTTPVNGMSAGNLNNSNPTNNLLTPTRANALPASTVGGRMLPGNTPQHIEGPRRLGNLTSDNRESSSYTRIPLSRQVVFNWTGVISNCLNVNDFDYIIKIVEVYANQNVQEAIDQNGTVNTYNNKSKTVYIHDTVANRHFRLVPGHVYAAQVQAVLKKNLMTDVQLSNDGKSQIITFVWGEDAPIVQEQNTSSQLNAVLSDNHEKVLEQIQNPYFVNPGQDVPVVDKLKSSNMVQASQLHTYSTYQYVTDVDAGDSPYYQVPVSDSIAAQWMPVCGDSVIKVVYTTELYEYNGGEVSNSMIGLPLKSASVTVQAPHNFSANNSEVLGVSTNGWADDLEPGYKYLLHLKAETYYSYEKKTTYTITDYIHNMPVDRDSVVSEVAYASSDLFSNVVFAWGVDSEALDKVYPPQFTYPMDLSKKNWYDTLMTEIPEVSKHEDFKFKWEAAKGVNYGDTAYYKLLVAKLPKGKKPQQVKDTLYIKDGITGTSYIDTALFDSLKTNEQYMAVLWTYIGKDGSKNSDYKLINKGKSIYATFKLVPPREYTADLSTKLKCYPNALKNLSKDTITPKVDSLVKHKVRLMMGDFPLVMQNAKMDTTKRYTGEGYVIWRPKGMEVPLKVHFDTIQINKDFKIINGTAASSVVDSVNYLSALMNDLDLDQWTNDDINHLASQFGSEEDVKKYYDSFKKYGEKYGKKYGGLLGPIAGHDATLEVLSFPLSINDELITGSENVIFSINNMFFSPTTALMNIWAIFAAQDDDYYVPFLANNICMENNSLFGKPDQHIDLFMARSYEKDLGDGYVLRFKASSNFADPKDGTVISIDSGKLNHITAEIQLDLNSNDFLGIEKDGTPRKGKTVRAGMMAKFRSWSDWIAKAYMDPFAVAGADRFTFYPTGKGIYYDHSKKETPKEVSLTYEYLFGTPPPKEMKEEDKKKLTKASKEWKGFYWDELTVFLSDEISNTFTDEEKPKDSMVVYRYGLNNTVVDSVHYSYPGSRINFGAKGLIVDDFGFSADFVARDIFKASTTDGGGWAFSLDTVMVRFTKGKYKEGIIKGGFGVPLLKGGFVYDCSIGADSLMFNVQPKKDTMSLDIWAADVNFVKESSYFRIKKIYKESKTRVDLTLNGHISLKTSKLGLPADFKAVKFEGMGMRNYNLANPKEGTASANGFEFTIGKWAFASPQKYIGGSVEGVDESQQTDDLGSVSFCGFTFSLKEIEPIAEADGDDLKLGVKVVGQMKFATEGTDLGATTGFSLWGVTETKNKFNVKDVQAHLDDIELNNIDFEVFKMSGKLKFTYACNTCKDITGFAGDLSITVMSEITLKMSAGFGKEKDSKGEYSWWFFDGACKFSGGIPLGAVSINGFSGGFAYNMKSKYDLTSDRYSAMGLLAQAEKNTDQDVVKSSGMDFEPSRDSWVANAGISMILTGAKNTMNADGLVSLRIVDKHFSGIFIEANAYVLTNMDENATPGDGSNNKSPLIRAKAIMGFETTDKYDYFRLSIAVKAKIDLASLLDGMSSTVLGEQIAGAIHSGTSLVTNSNIVNKLKSFGESSGIASHEESKRNTAANSSSGSSSTIGFNIEAQVPIDFELKHYKKNYEGHKKGNTDWYFAIGKPKYEERVQLKQKLNVAVLTSASEFTFYLQTGNAFAYEMPPLSKELQEFFGIANKEKKLDAKSSDVQKSRMIDNSDWLKIDKGGGFCMGATFHSESEMSFFLYLSITADLGFDVALLDVGGMGCPSHSNIGKHNFYALGRIYAALQGDVGLKLDLGFWKGKFSLFNAGVGALLQGGGPNPSYCYGLLRFKVNLLGGLLKFSTSCDFMLGDVCVPGAGDPLANVKLFESVTPGYEKESDATGKSNIQSPLQIGTIVSNMPWERDVLLCDQDGANARKFRFVLIQNKCKIATKPNTQFVDASGSGRLKFTPSNSDDNVYLFETEAGGFEQDLVQRLTLQARGFEYRKSLQGTGLLLRVTNEKNKDVSYDVNTGTPTNSYNTNDYAWYDPTFFDDKTKKIIVKPFKKDTTLFFKTHPLSEDLNDGVVFSWPYNGEPHFPALEYVHTNTGIPYCRMFLFTKYDNLFDKKKLEEQGKELKVYLLKNGLEDGEIAECTYLYYPNATVPYVDVQLPKKEYNEQNGKGAHMLKFLLVDKSAYNNAMAEAQRTAEMTRKQMEYSSRITDQTYQEAEAAHNRKNGKAGSFIGGSVAGSGSSVVGGDFVISGSISGIAGSKAGSYDVVSIGSYGSGTSSSSGQVAGSSSGQYSSNGKQQAYTASSKQTNAAYSSSTLGLAYTSGSRVTLSSSAAGSVSRKTTGASVSSVSLANQLSTSDRVAISQVSSSSGKLANSSTSQNRAGLLASAAMVTSGSGLTLATTSSNTKLNLQDEMLDEIYENKQDVGKDSMTYIRTMLKEGYKISAGIGKQIYKWTWFVKGSTYKDFIKAKMCGDQSRAAYKKDLADELSTASVDYWNNCFNIQGKNRDYYPGMLDWFGYMFLPYNPDDASLYHTSCEMPPVCYLVLDRTKGELMTLHQQYFQQFVDMERDFKKTELLRVFKCRVKDGKMKYDANDVFASGSQATVFQDILKGGFYLNNSVKFPRIDRRIKGGTDYTQCTANSYHPTTVDVPCILDVTTGYGYGSQVRKPMDEKYFEVANANRRPQFKCDDGQYRWAWKICDYATEAIAKDINMFYTFMYENQMHAQSLNTRDWSGKRSLFSTYYKESNRNAYMTYSNFPFDMPMIYRVVHYMRALQDLEPNTYYSAADGSSYKLINADREYIPVNKLQLQDRYWAKYWWSSQGQSTNVAKNGFDRDFYFYKENTRYYNVVCDQSYNGKSHNCSYPQSSILGSWYQPYDGSYHNPYKPVRKAFTMNVKLYYLSSQGPDFTTKLMNIAQAVKKSSVQTTKVFFPNMIYDTGAQQMQYTIPDDVKNYDPLYHRLLYPYNKLDNFRPSDVYGD